MAEEHLERLVPCNDNVPAIIASGRVPSKGRSACLGIVPLSNNVLGTDMWLKPSQKERSAYPSGVAIIDKEAHREGRLAH